MNDAGGSICELQDDSVLAALAQHTLILCIDATEDDERQLIDRAVACPKPLFFRQDFLDAQYREYLSEFGVASPGLIDPNEFALWIFPRLIEHRRPLYRGIADRYGYTVRADELKTVRDEDDFLNLVTDAIGRHAALGVDAA